MNLNLKHTQSNMIKQVKLGFSWTTLFFGGLPALFRGDLKWFLIMWIISVATLGLAWLVFPFVYNKVYIKGLLEKGYVPADDFSKIQLQSAAIISD